MSIYTARNMNINDIITRIRNNNFTLTLPADATEHDIYDYYFEFLKKMNSGIRSCAWMDIFTRIGEIVNDDEPERIEGELNVLKRFEAYIES